MSVSEAAHRLGLSADAVRKHVASGRLPGMKRGREWWLDAGAVERMARYGARAGRPLSPDMAWAVVLLASGDQDGARIAAGNARYWSRVRAWLLGHSLVEYSSRLRARAKVETFDAHPSEFKRILDRPDVLATGISAGDVVGLIGGRSAVEVYAPAGRRSEVIDEHALESGTGPVCIRWVPDELWSLLDRKRDAPRVAVLLDLLEHDDPRARREAARALAR